MALRPAGAYRPLQEIKKFYCEGIGLRKLGAFENHNGYNDLMIGLPGAGLSPHLEFTQHAVASPRPR